MIIPKTQAELDSLAEATLHIKELECPNARVATVRMLMTKQGDIAGLVSSVRSLRYQLQQIVPGGLLASSYGVLADAVEANIGPLLDQAFWESQMQDALNAHVVRRGTFRRADGKAVG